MVERPRADPAATHVEDGTDLLGLVLAGVGSVGTDSLALLRPVRGPDGDVVDFVVLADTGMTAQLAGQPSLGRSLRELMPAPFAQRLVELNTAVLSSGTTSREDFVLSADEQGSAAPPSSGHKPASARVGEVVRVPVGGHVVVLWRDVTEARESQRDLLATQLRFQRLVEHASDTIIVTTAERVITYASPSLRVVLNLDPASLIGTRFGNFFSERQDRTVGDDLYERVLRAPRGGTARAEAEVLRGDGQARRVVYVATNWLEDPVVGGVVINARDVTEQHELQQDLLHQALTDALTGLPNRRWFSEALPRALTGSRRSGRPFALLLLDVDNFKVLNDSLGHSAGDRLLTELGHRMASVLAPTESIARLGGDEFVVLAEQLDTAEDAASVAARVRAAAGSRYELDSLATHATVSIGVVTHDGDHQGPAGAEAEALLAHADAALYAAKHRGRNRTEVFDPDLRARLLHRVHLESELHQALDRRELTLHWQPIVRASDRRPVGAEALLRWQHPRRGLLPAAEFLPVASEVGLVPALCHWAVEAALETAAGWQSVPGEPMFFVNLAAAQLERPTLADEVAAAAERFGLDPGRVQLEVPEDVLGADARRLTAQLLRLRERGFRIALDDFGAGNTALTWLRRLPLDTLKLDREFAATLSEPRTRVVVRSLVQLAADLGVRTVAEGVETREQLEVFVEAGCDYTQGYLHGRPGPGDETVVRAAGVAR